MYVVIDLTFKSLKGELQTALLSKEQKEKFLKAREDIRQLREELQVMYDSHRKEQNQALELAREVRACLNSTDTLIELTTAGKDRRTNPADQQYLFSVSVSGVYTREKMAR
jgi:hypothetical protein